MSRARPKFAKPFLPSERDAEKRLRQDLLSVENYLIEIETRARSVRDTRDALVNDLAAMVAAKRRRSPGSTGTVGAR